MRTAKFGRTDVRKTSARGLALERLEPRMMLSVTTSQRGSTLVIRGNGDDDTVLISRDNGDIVVVANEDDPEDFSGIRNIDVDLGGGDDTLGVAQDEGALLDLAALAFFPGDDPEPIDLDEIDETDQTFLAGWLRIRMGSGDDDVGLVVDTGLHVDINTGSGLDRVGVLDSDIGTHLFVRSDRNDDQVGVFRSSVGTTLLVETGDGDDLVLVQDFGARNVTFNGGTGNDGMGLLDYGVRSSVVLLGGTGDDEIDAEFGQSSYLQINGDDGDDGLDADGVLVFGTLLILGGDGEDDVDVGPNDEFPEEEEDEFIAEIRGALIINGGDDADIVGIEDLEARSITMIGGRGDDELVAVGVTTQNHLIIIGDSGDDNGGIFDSEIGGFLHVILGSGNDGLEGDFGSFGLFNLFVGKHILVDAGSGNDEVSMGDIEALDHVLVLMGHGDDILDIFNVDADRITLDGGHGFDELFIDPLTRNRSRIRNFENVEDGDNGLD